MSTEKKITLPTQECTGCGACYNKCPNNSVKMISDKNGFIVPKINKKTCISCGQCMNVCPVLNPVYNNNPSPECRAVMADDEMRMKSSSGGVFGTAAEYVLDNGGVVCGVAYGDKFLTEHILIDNKNDLHKIQGSKYVQSDTKDIYKKVKKELESGKNVLFSGCPCQVAGLNSYLGRNYENLITLDIVCHGVPSPKAFEKYINDEYGNKGLEKIDFRDKSVYGWSSSVNMTFNDGSVYRDSHEKDPYYKVFLSNISVRSSCGNCKFSRLPRQGDLTVGDFWGISAYNREFNDKKGTSVVLVNNGKGADFMEKIKGKFKLDEKLPIDVAIRANRPIAHSFKPHHARKRFFNDIELKPFRQHAVECAENRYDVAIAGLWYGLNYGSVLTYYALYRVVNQLGYSALLLAKPKYLWTDRYESRETIAGQFIYKRCNVSSIKESPQEWSEINKFCDSFIVGSDVVWNYEICGKDSGNFFFLDFVNNSKKKIAYASSFGSGFNGPRYALLSARNYLREFDAVAVREDDAVKVCKNKFGVDADKVLDPVFLCDISYYDEAADSVAAPDKHPYMAAYILGPGPVKKSFLNAVKKSTGLPQYIMPNPNVSVDESSRKLGLPMVDTPSVEQWLCSIKNCEFFVGDSFHGLCFAIIFKRNFVIIVRKNLESICRFETLLDICGLSERLIKLDNTVEKSKGAIDKIQELVNKPIDYETVFKRLQKHKDRSLQWLKNALDTPKDKGFADTEKIADEVSELKYQVECLQRELRKMKNK